MSKNPYVLWNSPSGHERIYVGAAAWIEGAPDGTVILAGPGAARVSLHNTLAAANVAEGVLYRRLRRGLQENGLIPHSVVSDINEDGPKTGTYAAYKVSRETAAHILCWARAQGLTHIMRPSHMHTTTVYSREPIDYRPSNKPIGAKFEKFHLFPADSGESTLVAVVHSPALVDRWATALSAGATYDFPEYVPHISLGRVPSDFDLKTLDAFPFPIQYCYEFAQMTRPAAPEGAPKGYSIGHELMLLAGAESLWTRGPVGEFRRLGVPGTWETVGGPVPFGARDFVVRNRGALAIVSETEANAKWSKDLYYVQPDGRWKKGGDGRSKGRTRSELPKHATIADADDAEPRPVRGVPRYLTEDDCRQMAEGLPLLAGVPADSWDQEITIRVRAHENANAIESLLRRIEDETKGGSGTSITVETGGGKAEFYMDGDGGDIIEVVSVQRLNGGTK